MYISSGFAKLAIQIDTHTHACQTQTLLRGTSNAASPTSGIVVAGPSPYSWILFQSEKGRGKRARVRTQLKMR